MVPYSVVHIRGVSSLLIMDWTHEFNINDLAVTVREVLNEIDDKLPPEVSTGES